MLPSHLFKDSCDGALFDTRNILWHRCAPLRAIYERTFAEIKSVAEFKATLRAGRFAWPGGYPMYFMMSDGESMSFESARREFRQIVEAIQNKSSDGWRVVACDINYENGDLFCCHSGERIESAYAESETAEA